MSLWQLLLINLICLVIYMSLWWLSGRSRQRLDVVDTAWGGGYIIAAVIGFVSRQNVRTSLIAVLVLVWGLRIAVHIWRRSGKRGPDRRYEELSSKWNQKHLWLRAYFSVFLLQGLIILIVSLPITVGASENIRPPIWLLIVAGLVWLSGFLIESVADKQLGDFINNDSNKCKVMKRGLWHYSRHPNYFGELLQWWAISLLALGPKAGYLGLIGPAVLTLFIVFISGIPSIEKSRSKDPAYNEYKKQTSVLIPLPPRQL
jgi:steroid 5-alpha reductase family enzyme